jgi:alkylation response protein AidB-like acyl-CoA dehydrogenase
MTMETTVHTDRKKETHPKTAAEWIALVEHLGVQFRARADEHDRGDSFVRENYKELKEHRFFGVGIPKELGGEGMPHSTVCDILRVMAHYCSSTALAHSMHQHLVGANIWKYKKGQGAEQMLRMVAEKQPVLVSTGAKDWLESNGELTRTDGGYRFTAKKVFASQSAVGDILVTSGPYQDPQKGWQVFHFTVPFSSEGVSLMDDWYTMGMRATGSQTVSLQSVFIPDSAIVIQRSRGEFHPFFNVIATEALPLVMSVYVGVAQRAVQIALGTAGKKQESPHLPYLLGEMNNSLTAAEVQLQDMIRIANNFDFEAIDKNGHEAFTRKTNVANACINTVAKAMEVAGGQGFYRKFGLEKLFRDVQGARYHPMQEKEQLLFSGNFLLKSSD